MTSAPLMDQRAIATPAICALWEWVYDDDFVGRLRQQSARRGITFADYMGERVTDFIRNLNTAANPIRLIIDRVSDDQPGITVPLIQLKRQGTILVNDPEQMAWCRDKATLHFALLEADVRVPYSVIVSTAEHPESMDVLKLVNGRLGNPFVIKPAEGGGGTNVILNAHDHQDILDYLDRTGEGKIVLQRKVLPCRFEGKRAWFRIFWVLGQVIPCWWDDLTHIYQAMTDKEQHCYDLQRLSTITALVAKISRMDLFTTEIAIGEDGECVVVDAVNEMPDFRLQSRHPDGVPDSVVDRIVEILVDGASGPSTTRKPAREQGTD